MACEWWLSYNLLYNININLKNIKLNTYPMMAEASKASTSYAYVKFIDDGVFSIVKTHKIKKFNPENLNKKYNIKHTDGVYYQACVLHIGDSVQEIESHLEGTKRLTHRPLHLMQSCTETDDDTTEADVEEKKILKKKNKSVKKLKQNEEIVENFNSIMEELDSVAGMKPPSVKDCDISMKPPLHKDKKNNTYIKKLEEENTMLRKLNVDLQREVIDCWKELRSVIENLELTKDNKEEQITPPTVGARSGGRVHLGRDVYLNDIMYDAICCRSKTDSIFVKNMASAIFGDHVLAESSVTGGKCNRVKAEQKPKLSETKFMALKDIYQFHLTQKGETSTTIELKLKQLNQLLAQKIADLRRNQKKSAPINVNIRANNAAVDNVTEDHSGSEVDDAESDYAHLSKEIRETENMLANEENQN